MMLAGTVSNLLGPRMRIALRKPIIENFAFKLHYQLTVTLLLVAVILVCARDYIGESIRCMADAGVPTPLIEKYCFFMATFTIVSSQYFSILALIINLLLNNLRIFSFPLAKGYNYLYCNLIFNTSYFYDS